MSSEENQPVENAPPGGAPRRHAQGRDAPRGDAPRSRPLIAGNWKMHKLPSEAAAWLRELLAARPAAAAEQVGSEIALLVPFTHLPGMAKLAFGSGVAVGAQDLSSHAQGAYTGEVSGPMLRDAGAQYVIVGHSERRAYHHEDDELVNAKVAAAVAAHLVPILCVGESREERAAGSARDVVLRQLAGALEGLHLADPAWLVVAYEPVWAIGTGLTATAADAQEMCAIIRAAISERYGAAGADVRVLYGGSMKPANAAELLSQPDIDGGLIGGASLEVADLLAIAAAA